MMRTRRSGSFHALVVVLAVLLQGGSAWAEDASGTGRGSAPAGDKAPNGELPVQDPDRPSGRSFDLDPLLRLPSSYVTNEPRAVAGAGESEWRRRFTTAVEDLTAARAKLEATKRELDGMAVGGGSSQWSIAPPGAESAGSSTSPISFKLRQQLREQREQVEDREKALRELRIEADLAGVPQTWRVDPAPTPTPTTAAPSAGVEAK